jgi:hypothetical protein
MDNQQEKDVKGRYCMVRSKSAGVFAGTVEKVDGQTALLRNARRIWYWEGAASLSQLAAEGTKAPTRCMFPCPVAEVLLFEVIEIIPITEEAAASIAIVPEWRS